MTNSLLAVHPAVQHMVLHLMNINAVKYKWSSGTGLMAFHRSPMKSLQQPILHMRELRLREDNKGTPLMRLL